MLYEELKSLENHINKNAYFEISVGYYFYVNRLDNTIPADVAIKNFLIKSANDCFDISKEPIIVTPVETPMDDLKALCTEWHFNDETFNKIYSLIDGGAKLYKFCEDYACFPLGTLSEVLRILETENEQVIIDFYIWG